MLSPEQILFLEKMQHCFDPAVFAGSDGMSPEKLNLKIREVYDAGEREGIPFPVTRARMVAAFLENVRIAVNDFDPFAAVVERRTLSSGPKSEILFIQQERKAFYAKLSLGEAVSASEAVKTGVYRSRLDLSHTSPDWDNVLTLGVPGLLKRAEDNFRKNPSPFAESVCSVYEAFRQFLLRYGSFAEKQGRHDLSEMLFFLADHAPGTLHQALELSLLYREVQEIEGEWVRSMGIFDRMFRPFYEADLAAARLTQESARVLVCAYFSRFFVQSGGLDNGTPFCFGGGLPDEGEGIKDGCCELTEIAWQAFRDLGRTDPKFSLRVNPETPENMLRFAAECIQEGKTSMVFANEKAAEKMFLRHGKIPADLFNFLPVGCYEPVIMGKELSCTMTVLFNFAGLFEELFNDNTFAPVCFEDVLQKYLALQKKYLAEAMTKADALEKYWKDVQPSPLLSGTMDDCMERNLDVSCYGTRYSTSGVMCAGLGTAADSLEAIRQLVFVEHKISFPELGELLNQNWMNQEQLRLYAVKRVPKWGNGRESVDSLAEIIAHSAGEQIKGTPNVKGGHYQMGLWSIDWCYIFGRETGATPDGRRSGDPLARNSGSTTACDKEGIAGLIDSVSKLDHSFFADGAVLDLMLSPHSVTGTAGIELIVRLIRTFFARGGLFLQFNMLSPETLRAAQQNPQKYSNLQIRLCGWNVRFIDLAPHIQETFIAEAENGAEN